MDRRGISKRLADASHDECHDNTCHGPTQPSLESTVSVSLDLPPSPIRRQPEASDALQSGHRISLCREAVVSTNERAGEACMYHEMRHTIIQHVHRYILWTCACFRKKIHAGLLSYMLVSVMILIVLIYLSFFGASVNGKAPERTLGCRYWGYWPGPTCGLNGIDCEPFTTDWTAFRCPSGCLTGTKAAS
jgi:hypothetical protein